MEKNAETINLLNSIILYFRAALRAVFRSTPRLWLQVRKPWLAADEMQMIGERQPTGSINYNNFLSHRSHLRFHSFTKSYETRKEKC